MTYLLITFCSSMKHSKYFSFVDTKIVGTVSSATDCTLLQSDVDSIRGCSVANNIIRSTAKLFIIFTVKINYLNSTGRLINISY